MMEVGQDGPSQSTRVGGPKLPWLVLSDGVQDVKQQSVTRISATDRTVTPLNQSDMYALIAAVYEMDARWNFAMRRFTAKSRPDPSPTIIMYWGRETEFIKPSIHVKNTPLGYNVTIIDFLSPKKHAPFLRTTHDRFTSVIAMFKLTVRRILEEEKHTQTMEESSLQVSPKTADLPGISPMGGLTRH